MQAQSYSLGLCDKMKHGDGWHIVLCLIKAAVERWIFNLILKEPADIFWVGFRKSQSWMSLWLASGSSHSDSDLTKNGLFNKSKKCLVLLVGILIDIDIFLGAPQSSALGPFCFYICCCFHWFISDIFPTNGFLCFHPLSVCLQTHSLFTASASSHGWMAKSCRSCVPPCCSSWTLAPAGHIKRRSWPPPGPQTLKVSTQLFLVIHKSYGCFSVVSSLHSVL